MKVDPMKHGGDLGEAVAAFGGDRADWLDLSTGISPIAYPFDPPSETSWGRLPQSDKLDGLLAAARQAYGAPADAPIIASPGTQLLIQLLPIVKPAARVVVLEPTYSEHAKSWRRAGSDVTEIYEPDHGGDVDIVVLTNPNNPDGWTIDPAYLLLLAESIAARDGLLIVDEAFADIAPEMSLTGYAGRVGLVILRSFGKFFGLAGLRLGFALGPADLIGHFKALLGPWAVSGPAIDIGIQALSDLEWQRTTRNRLNTLAERLDAMLTGAGLEIAGGTALYRLAMHPDARNIHRGLARERIWVRAFDDHPYWLRFGLPGSEAAFERLASAFHALGLSQRG